MRASIANPAIRPDKKTAPGRGGLLGFSRVESPGRASDYLYDLACLEAAGAYLEVGDAAVNHGLHLEEVGTPGPPRAVLRVGNGISERRAFAANLASSSHAGAPIELVKGVYR